MYKFPIGAMLDSFRLDDKTAMAAAAKIGIKGLQVYAVSGQHSPENLVGEKRREFLKLMEDNGLVLSALCGDTGKGFHNKELNPQTIELSKRVLDLGKELGTDIVTTHIGIVPEDETCDTYKIMQEACFELARYADEIGSHFAVETGPELAVTLKKFLDSLNSTGVAVNLDPANFVMVTGDDPVQAVYTLKDYIVHTHAKDGRKLLDLGADKIYGKSNHAENVGRPFIELPLGEGDVDFANYLKALDEIGYKGFLTIERECGDNPSADIEHAARFLKDLIG